jgi:hypothetical protein
MLEKLGEAYVSNRLGKVSREHLANKALVLYFEGKNKDEELMRAMQQAYQHFGCEEQTTGLFEIIYVTAAKTAAQFASSFRHMPWLSLPFTHALRREQLRHLFEVGEEKDAVVLLHMDGSTISREGSLHVKLAYRCQSSLNDKKQENKNQMELTKRIAKEAKQTATLETRLQKGVVAKLARCTTQLCKQMRKREFDEFIGSEQAELPPELARQVSGAETALEGARVGIKALDSALLEQICAASEPPSDQIKESVEAIGVILGLKPDFGNVQARVMAREDAFRDRLLSFNKAHVPQTARARLRKFLSGTATEPVASALRAWVTALVNYEQVAEDEAIAREQHACTPVMQAACECLCDLHGMHAVEDDLRGALLMADKFAASDVATMAEEAEQDEEVRKLQEQTNTLNNVIKLMEQGLKDAVKMLPELQDSVRNSDFNHTFGEVPSYLDYIISPQGSATELHANKSAAINLLKATIWISKPSLMQSGGSSGETLSVNELVEEANKNTLINELVRKIRDAANETASEQLKPSPDVTDAEWAKFNQLLEGVHTASIQKPLLSIWHVWCTRAFARFERENRRCLASAADAVWPAMRCGRLVGATPDQGRARRQAHCRQEGQGTARRHPQAAR